MSDLIQHALVITIVVAAAGFIAWQVVAMFRLGGKPIGRCCTRGCSAGGPAGADKGEEGGKSSTPASDKIAFIPVENLRVRRARR